MLRKTSRFTTVATLFTLGSSMAFADSEPLVLEEIIVTAQKRAQSVQDVPIAVTALTGDMLADQNIYDIVDLQRAVPSLTVIKGYNRANQPPIVIRGIGTIGTQPAFEGSVGVYIDGVYRSRPGMALSSMLDIGRVEVLRGPQGTLFGKNTVAGALTMASVEPDQAFAYGGEVTLGDYDRRRLMAYVNGALGDNVSARLAVLQDQREGFTEALFEHDDYGNLDTQAVKLSVVWEASDDLSVKLIADYSDSDEVCCFGNPVPFNRADSLTGGPFTDFNREAAQANFATDIDLLALDPEDRENQNNLEPRSENTEQGLVIDINYDLGFADLRSITGYRDWQYTSAGDFDFGPIDIGALVEDYDVESISQEFTLAGSSEALGFIKGLDYVAGLFYATEDFQQRRAFNAGHDQAGVWELFWPARAGLAEPVLRALLGGGEWAVTGEPIGDVLHELDSETLAVFGHVTAALTEQLSLIIGLRYSEEEKTLDRKNLLYADVEDYSAYLQENMLGGYMLGANVAGPDMDGLKYNDDEWTYDLKFQYFLSPDAQFYGGYSRGFKAGGIGMDPEAGGGQPSGLNSPLLLQLAGQGNGTGFADLIDPSYAPEYIDTWELGVKADFLDGRARTNIAAFYNDIEDNQFSVFTGTGFRVLNASSSEVVGIELESLFAVTQNLRLGFAFTWLDTEYGDDIPEPTPPGRELTLAPEWATALNLGYEHGIGGNLAAYVNANWAYRGEQYLSYDIQDKEAAYSLLGLQAGLRNADGDWDLRIWCDNCLDETYGTSYFNTPFYFDDNLEQYQGQFLGPPRTYGLSLRVNL
ncbi:MAG: TonB-dependent receptor [Halioglobus sp.]